MFKKIFNGIVDICKPGDADPMCQFGGPLQNSKQQLKSDVLEEEPKGLWQKVKNLGKANSAR